MSDVIKDVLMGKLFGGGGVQPDWNQNDETQPDYVKNRTHWVEGGGKVIQPETALEQVDTGEYYGSLLEMPEEGNVYTFTYNGVTYDCTVGAITLGDGSSVLNAVVEGVFDAAFFDNDGIKKVGVMPLDGATSITMSIALAEVVQPLDEKFIPNTIARKTDLEALGGSGGAVVLTFTPTDGSWASVGENELTPSLSFKEAYTAFNGLNPAIAYLNISDQSVLALQLVDRTEGYGMTFVGWPCKTSASMGQYSASALKDYYYLVQYRGYENTAVCTTVTKT